MTAGTTRATEPVRTGAPAAPDRERPAFLTAVIVFAVLAIVLPLSVLDTGAMVGNSTNVVLAYVVTGYSAFMIAKLCYSAAGSITRLAFFVFCYVFMGLSVYVQVADVQFPLAAPNSGAYTDGEIRRALYTTIIGIAAFEIGTLISHALAARKPRNRPMAASAPGKTMSLGRLASYRVWEVSRTKLMVLGVFGLAVTGYYVSRVGIAPFFDSRQAAANAILGNDNPTGTAYSAANKLTKATFRVFAQTPILLSLFGILYMKHHKLWDREKRGNEVGTAVMTLLLIVANVIVNSPTGNSRYWFSTVAITLVSVYVPLTKARGIRWAAILSVVTLLFAFTTLQAFRRAGGAREYSAGFRNDLVSSGTYSEFQIELIGQQWVAEHGHTDGQQLLSAILVFVPRSFWTSKPPDTGNLILPIYNPAASLWTEGDVEAGWLGVGAYFLLLGLGTAAVDRRMRTAVPGSIAHATIPIAGGFMILVLRGSLLIVIAAAYGLTAMVLLITRWRRMKGERASAVDQAPDRRALSVS